MNTLKNVFVFIILDHPYPKWDRLCVYTSNASCAILHACLMRITCWIWHGYNAWFSGTGDIRLNSSSSTQRWATTVAPRFTCNTATRSERRQRLIPFGNSAACATHPIYHTTASRTVDDNVVRGPGGRGDSFVVGSHRRRRLRRFIQHIACTQTYAIWRNRVLSHRIALDSCAHETRCARALSSIVKYYLVCCGCIWFGWKSGMLSNGGNKDVWWVFCTSPLRWKGWESACAEWIASMKFEQDAR